LGVKEERGKGYRPEFRLVQSCPQEKTVGGGGIKGKKGE